MLKTEIITVLDKTFTLGEHTLYIDFKRENLIGKAIEENKADDDIAGQLMRIGYVNLTAAIVDGTPPSFEDVLFRVSTEDTAQWSAAARRLNPQWFPAPEAPSDTEYQTEQRKKKKIRRGKSTQR
ncbi:MAG: hypothetical protein NTW69_06280 [Chloroflexi bacterium]|nr:hypothetical protein [Chloroflexota bacterium]